tara:strand:+ start:1130 stop:1888 length:759 start_codon:yes stop_codon:yes gene_type:complete
MSDPHINIYPRYYNWYISAKGMFEPQFMFFLLAIFYYPCILYGRKFMKDKPPFILKKPLFIWNTLLSFFSFYGFIVLFPYIYEKYNQNTLNTMICKHEIFYTSKVAYIIAIFNATKCLEWGDTVFLILRKKPIIFLHWYHHLVTYLFCWHGTMYSYKSDATGVYFCAMNLFVHFIMYGYYALSSINIRLPYSWIITVLQTIQMFIGVFLLLYTPFCKDSWSNNWFGNIFGSIMYGSYTYLFSKILINKLSHK